MTMLACFIVAGMVVVVWQMLLDTAPHTYMHAHYTLTHNLTMLATQQLIKGLDYMWEKHRAMHRDIKPSNALIGYDGSIKLCDFGLANIAVDSILVSNVGSELYLSVRSFAQVAVSLWDMVTHTHTRTHTRAHTHTHTHARTHAHTHTYTFSDKTMETIHKTQATATHNTSQQSTHNTGQ